MIVFQSLKWIAFSIYLLKSEQRNAFFPEWLWLLKWSERVFLRARQVSVKSWHRGTAGDWKADFSTANYWNVIEIKWWGFLFCDVLEFTLKMNLCLNCFLSYQQLGSNVLIIFIKCSFIPLLVSYIPVATNVEQNNVKTEYLRIESIILVKFLQHAHK